MYVRHKFLTSATKISTSSHRRHQMFTTRSCTSSEVKEGKKDDEVEASEQSRASMFSASKTRHFGYANEAISLPPWACTTACTEGVWMSQSAGIAEMCVSKFGCSRCGGLISKMSQGVITSSQILDMTSKSRLIIASLVHIPRINLSLNSRGRPELVIFPLGDRTSFYCPSA